MDDTKVISDKSGRPSLPALRIRPVAHFSMDGVEVDKSDDGDEDISEEVRYVESSIVDETGSGDSAPSFLEENHHERDDQDEEKPDSSEADLRDVESSSPSSAEAKLDHSDGEAKDKSAIPGLPPNTASAEPPDTRSANQKNDTEDNRMSSIDISTMKMAIQSGNPKAVDDLMERLSDALAVDELNTTYGGGYKYREVDDNNLFRGASPILHAARSGNLAVFESVMKAMQAKLSRKKAKEILEKKDIEGHSLLSLAALGGNKGILESVLLVIQQEFSEYEVKDMLATRDRNGVLPVEMAARSGSMDVLGHVICVVRKLFENENVLGGDERAAFSLLASAVRSGSVDVVEHVLLVIRQEFSENAVVISYHPDAQECRLRIKVNEIIQFRDRFGASLPACAASSGSSEMFKNMLNLATEKLGENKKRDILTSTDFQEATMLALAVSSGNRNTFETVLETVIDLSGDEVKGMIICKGKNGCGLLRAAVISGRVDMFKAVMATISDKLAKDEVKHIISSRTNDGNSWLSLAVESKNVEMFKAMMVVVVDNLPEEEVKKLISSKSNHGHGLLMTAAFGGRVQMFKAVMATISDKLTEQEVKEVILCKGKYGDGILNEAVISGRVEMYKAVMATISDKLAKEEVKEIILCTGNKYGSLLNGAVLSGRVEMFKAVMATISDKLTVKEVKNNISRQPFLLSSVVRSKSVEMFKAVMTFIVDYLLGEEVVELLRYKHLRGHTPLGQAIRHGNLDMCETIVRKVQDYLGYTKMQDALDATFMSWTNSYEEYHPRFNITRESRLSKILSMLIRHSARPPTGFLQWAAHDVTDGREHLWPIFTESLLIGVESASNPLIPGMNLSVPLAEAAEGAREGERRRLISLQKRVDEYVLEVLERLPQTIQGFDDDMSQCSALFEPEGPRNDICGRPGPLRVAFERRDQMESLCAVPLVMDYLSHRFTSGLPDMLDSGRVLQDETALSRLAEDDMGVLVLGDTQEESFLRDNLQGADASKPSLSILPGAQFIIAGLLAKPNIYYRVPAMRMALDFVVYIMMLYNYSFWVLLQEDGPLTTAEIIFAFYVLAGVLTEAAEIRRNIDVYRRDPWNFLDALALVMLTGGFSVRLANGDNPWGRALYASSAPLVFARILFFMQILQFQGPMIQVMFSMGMVLLQFAVVLLVVMMGFAMALYPLLRYDNTFTFGAILLLLFKTLLGDVEAFEEFDESTQNRYSTVGQLLLAVYLVVMTIMLLNLLIAVLSTKHTNMDANADKEYKVSRARIIEHYRLVVAFNILPAPFNLWQLVLTSLLLLKRQSAEQNKKYTKTMEAVGQVSFWIVLSPLVFAGGVLLWVTSSMYNIGQVSKWLGFFRTRRHLRGPSLAFAYIKLVFWCALGAPLCLLGLWLRQPFLVIHNGVIPSRIRPGQRERGDSTPTASASRLKTSDADVQKMLRDAGTGASDLRKYLEDPMCDPKVRPDEVDRGTTVKHMKLLRDRLEKKLSEHIDHLDKKLIEHVDHLGKEFNERVVSLEKNFNVRVNSLEANNELVLEILRRK